MTIKYENCPQCNNRGIIRRYVFNAEPFLIAPPPGVITTPIPVDTSRIQEEYCNCVWGFEKKRFDEKTESPDWVNPLEGLSDEELLTLMDRSHENQQAIDQEFY
ncbi:MAG: hypothetical protein ACRC2V_12315 [Xenococcaceae cyanobacterium]